MKTFILFLTITLNSLMLFSQTADWTKDDRNNVYEESMSALTTYSNITKEQKESISLCYLDAITEKYTKKDYQAKIEVEIKRIREATINQCAKNIGVELTSNEVKTETKIEQTETTPTKEGLTGHWKDDNSEFWLFETGDFRLTGDNGTTATGTWKINGNLFTMTISRTFSDEEIIYQILMYSKDKFVYQYIGKGKDTYTANRVK